MPPVLSVLHTKSVSLSWANLIQTTHQAERDEHRLEDHKHNEERQRLPVPYLWCRERCTPAWQIHLEKRREGRARAVRAPRHCRQRAGSQRDAAPRPHSSPVPPPQLPPEIPVGWGQPQARPRLEAAAAAGQSHPARAAPAALHRRVPRGCSGTFFPQHAGAGTGRDGRHDCAVAATMAQQPRQQRHTQRRVRLEARRGRAPGPGLTSAPPAPAAPAPGAPALRGLRQRGGGEGPRPGAGGGARSSPGPPCVPPPALAAAGAPRPALTGLVVVVDLHLGGLQAPHGDVPLHREGEAQGVAGQLGKGSGGG